MVWIFILTSHELPQDMTIIRSCLIAAEVISLIFVFACTYVAIYRNTQDFYNRLRNFTVLFGILGSIAVVLPFDTFLLLSNLTKSD